MRQCAVIGLGAFGRQVAQELSQLGVQRIIVRGEADVRRRHGVIIVAGKKIEAEEHDFPSPGCRFLTSDILLGRQDLLAGGELAPMADEEPKDGVLGGDSACVPLRRP